MSISIDIVAGDTKNHSSISAHGSTSRPITNNDLNHLGLNIYPAIQKYHGKKPNQAYFHSPTPGAGIDLYKHYHWPEVKAKLEVISSRIVGINLKPIAVATFDYNNESEVKATFRADLSQQVSETSQVSWSTTHGFQFNQQIEYGVEFSGVNIGGATSMGFTQDYGTGGSETQLVSISSTQGVSFDLGPGESETATFSANKGTLMAEVVYRVSFAGDVAANYNPAYKNHHFKAFNINKILAKSKLDKTFDVTQTIEIGYYLDGSIDLG